MLNIYIFLPQIWFDIIIYSFLVILILSGIYLIKRKDLSKDRKALYGILLLVFPIVGIPLVFLGSK
jgi:uncharacterized membrane protein YozB (DUF420 family)